MPIHADLLYILLCALPCGLALIVLGIWIYIAKNAPDAYEDETGFHMGEKPK